MLQALRDTLKDIQSETPPSIPEEQEAFFQEQVAEGEKLAALGKSFPRRYSC